MKLASLAIVFLFLGVALGFWISREYFRVPFQVNVKIVPGSDISVIPNDNAERAILIRVNENVFDFESPCVSRQLRRDKDADDYFELSGRLPKADVNEPYFVDGQIRSFSFRCDKVLYGFDFDDVSRTTSVSLRSF